MSRLTRRRTLAVAFLSARFFVALTSAVVVLTMVPGSTASAQDNAPSSEAGQAAADDQPEEQSVLSWAFQSLGISYTLVFLGLSFTLVALIVMNLLTARRENVVPIGLVENFEAELNEKRWNEAYELAKGDDSFLGRVLSAGLPLLKRGYEPAIEAMQEVGEEENMKMDHRLSYLALIGTVSPMIGLFGTVQGMIAAFSVIANSPVSPKPAELAAGISTALFTTLLGLAIAIPAIAAYSILRNRVARMHDIHMRNAPSLIVLPVTRLKCDGGLAGIPLKP